MDEIQKYINEGGLCGDYIDSEIELSINDKWYCERGLHNWKLYVGLTDRFYYCTVCDAKKDYRAEDK